MADYYSLLDVSENASEEDIRKAYRRMAKQFHPDINKSQDAQAHFVLINKAYEVLMDRQKKFAYDQKNKATTDPFYYYARWAQEQQARQEAETQRRQKEFLRKKEQIRESKLYYPYKMALYMTSIILMGLSVLVLVGCAFVILKYHIFLFFFLLPFICGAAYLLKVTLDGYRKYKALFS